MERVLAGLPLAEIIILLNSGNKTLLLDIDFMDMVIRQLFVKKKEEVIDRSTPANNALLTGVLRPIIPY